VENAQENVTYCSCNSCGQVTENTFENICENGCPHCGRAANAQKAFNQTSEDILKRESRELEHKARIENQILLKKQRELIKIEKSEGTITAEKQKQIDLLKEEINVRSQAIIKMEADQSRLQQKITPNNQGPPGNTGPIGQTIVRNNGGGGIGGFFRNIAIGGMLSGGLNAAAAIGTDINTRRGALTRAEGGAAYGASRDMRELYGNRGSDRFFWRNERAQAADILRDEYEDKRALSVLGAGGRAVGGGLLGAGAGAGIGSFLGAGLGGAAALGLGAMTGGVGLAAGGAMMAGGAKIGGWLGAAAGGLMGGSMAMGREGRTAIFDPERFNKENLAQAFKDREGLEMALMYKDPRKMIAREHFMKNTERYSALQRQLGLGDEATFGKTGFLQNQMNQGEMFGGLGFQEKDIISSFRGLRGASGLTASRELTGRAAAVQRQLGIENAPELMGQLMGQGKMDAGQTDEAFKRIMAEAVSMGVDATEMSAEMQNFATVATEIATQGGGFSDIAVKQLAGVGGRFGSAEMQAAKNQFQEFEKRAGAGAGFEGQLGFGFFSGDKATEAFGGGLAEKIRKNPQMMNVLNQMSASELEKSGQLQGFAEMLGGEGASEEEIQDIQSRLISGVKEKDIFKQSRTQRGEDLLRKYKTGVEEAGGEEAFLKTKEGRSIRSQLFLQRGAAYGSEFIKQGALGTSAELGLAAGVESQGGMEDLAKIDKAMTGDLGRAAEAEKGARAVGDRLRINEMSNFSKEFIKSAGKVSEESEVLGAQFSKLTEVIKEKGGDLESVLTTLEKQLERLADKAAEAGSIQAKPRR
jgi:hypothetical protein